MLVADDHAVVAHVRVRGNAHGGLHVVSKSSRLLLDHRLLLALLVADWAGLRLARSLRV